MNNNNDDHLNKKEIIQKSLFLSQEFSGKNWINLFFLKNTFFDYLISNEDLIKMFKKQKIDFMFIEQMKIIMQNLNSFKTYFHLFKTTTNEETNFQFAIKESSTSRQLTQFETLIQEKDLVIKINPNQKVIITIDNIEDMFLLKDFNKIDFSKNIFQNNNFKSFEEILKLNTNNEENTNLIEVLYDIKNNLNVVENKIIENKITQRTSKDDPRINEKNYLQKIFSETDKNDNILDGYESTETVVSQKFKKSIFSSVLGFSIKSTSVRDLDSYDPFKIEKDLPDIFKLLYERNYVGYLKVARPNNDKKINDQPVSYLKNNKYTITFFSPFYESNQNNEEDKTYLIREYQTSSSINIESDKVNLNEQNLFYIDDVKFIQKEKFKKLTSKIKGSIFNIEIARYNDSLTTGQSQHDIEYLNKKENFNLNIIDEFKYENDDLVISLNYIILEKYIANSKIYNDYVKTNRDIILFYHPTINLETLNISDSKVEVSRTKTIKKEDISIKIKNVEKIIGKIFKVDYKISIDDIINNIMIKDSAKLRSLSRLYNKKYFFSNAADLSKSIVNSIEDNIKNINNINDIFHPGVENPESDPSPINLKNLFKSEINTDINPGQGKLKIQLNDTKSPSKSSQNNLNSVLKVIGNNNKTQQFISNNFSNLSKNKVFIPQEGEEKILYSPGEYRVYKRDKNIKLRHDKKESSRASRWKNIVRKAAKKYNLPEALIWAHMKFESDFVNKQNSPKGAQGLMQLMPSVASDYKISDRMDPKQNIFGAARLINAHKKNFKGNLVQMISAYHAGGKATRTAISNYKKQNPDADTSNVIVSPSSTNKYVNIVLNNYYYYLNNPLFNEPINNNNQKTLKETKIETQQSKENSNNKEDETKNKKSKLKSINLRKNNPLSKEEIEDLRNQSKMIRSSSPLPDSSLLKSENKNQGDSNESIFSYDNQGAPLPSLN